VKNFEEMHSIDPWTLVLIFRYLVKEFYRMNMEEMIKGDILIQLEFLLKMLSGFEGNH
jgi:hypothetical protein